MVAQVLLLPYKIYRLFVTTQSSAHSKHAQKLHPAGLQHDWADKLYGQNFTSESAQSTHEHYLQVRGCCCCCCSRWVY